MKAHKDKIITWVIALVLGALGGILGGVMIEGMNPPTQDEQLAAYYTNSVAALVSPHHLRKEMDLGNHDEILVDVRTHAEYVEEHVVGALNVDASQSKEDVVAQFRELEKLGKPIIIYCYSSACLTGRKVGKLLSDNGVFVHELSIGWNEWRYEFNSWNYPNEWEKLDSSRYVVSGEEPGELEKIDGEIPAPCRIDGPLGC